MHDTGETSPLGFPLYPSSVYTLEDLDAVDRVTEGQSDGYIYARDAHPNARRLSSALAQMEGAHSGVICGSGMAALSALLISLVGKGQRLLAGNLLYGRTIQLLKQELPRYGIETELVDPCNLPAVQEAMRSGSPRAFLVETMSNPLLRVVDIPALAGMAQQHNCLLIVDNTFATPVLCKPLTQGAHFVVESLTKMISGHSDATLGWVGIGDLPDAEEWQAQITQVMSIWGFSGSPFDSWLTDRGMQTLELRMHAACHNAAQLAPWLTEQNTICRVAYPGLSDHPDHAIASRVLSHGYGNLISFELEGGREAVNALMRAVPQIPFSPSLGNVTTTWSHPDSTSHRYVSPAEKKRQGITPGVIRMSVGAERFEVLNLALKNALLS